MKIVRMLIIALLLCIAFVGLAHAQTAQWSKTYGGTGNDFGYAMQLCSDGGYIVAGSTASSGNGSDDFWLMKTDTNGNQLWNKTYGGTGSDNGRSVQLCSDGGYILVGSTASFGNGSNDFWLMKTDTNGNMLWNKTYGGTGNDIGRSVQQCSDGGYVFAGSTGSFGNGSNDFWLVRTDANGNMLWNKTYGGTGSDNGYALQICGDWGYIVTGYTASFGNGSDDFWLVRTDANGNQLWNKTYGGTNADDGNYGLLCSDGGYIVTGTTNSFGNGNSDIWLVRTDANGNQLWNKTYGGTNGEDGYAVWACGDGGYALAGDTKSFGSGNSDLWLVRTDANGNQLWNKTYGGTNTEYDYDLRVTSSGQYIISGTTNSFGNGSFDAYLIKAQDDPAAVADFSANATYGPSPFVVQFTDLSAYATAWQWNFGDGTPNSTVQNPVHTYLNAGTYTVTLTASNYFGGNTVTKEHMITADDPLPVTNFSANVSFGYSPVTVQFTDLSANATAWQWNFGDGTPNSTDRNPIHTYATIGSFDVTLTAANQVGSVALKKAGVITVVPHPANVTFDESPAWVGASGSVDVNYTLTYATGNRVYLQVYDSRNLTVRTINAGLQTSGTNTIIWNGCYDNGTHVPEGNYTMKVFVYDNGSIPSQTSWSLPLYQPMGLAMDSSGTLYIAETNAVSSPGTGTISIFYPNGTFRTMGTIGQRLYGLAIDAAGNLYATDATSKLLYKIYPNETVVTLASGFTSMSGLAVDSSGNVYVADGSASNSAIKKVFPNGTVATFVSGISSPRGVAVDSSGNVYVCAYLTSNMVKIYYPNGTLIKSLTGLRQCWSIAVDSSGYIYVGNLGRSILKVALDGTYTTLASGIYCQYGIVVDSAGKVYASDSDNRSVKMIGTDGTVTALDTNLPGYVMDVAVGADGRLYVDDTGDNTNANDVGKVRVLNSDGTVSALAGGFRGSYSMAVDYSGNVYVADTGNNAVRKVLPDGTTTLVGAVNTPKGVAVDSIGNVYASDTANSAVKIFYANGSTGSLGSGFSSPNGVFVDATGNVYVADNGNNAVKVVYVNGTVGTLASGFNDPRDVAVDSAGNVYVADYGNKQVKMICTNGSILTLATMSSQPTGLSIDGLDNVYATDLYNVIRLSGSRVESGSLGVSADLLAPVTTCVLYGDISGGVYTGPVTVNLTAADPGPGAFVSGVNATYYSLDGTTWSKYTGNVTVNSAGANTVYYYSKDNASNVETTGGVNINVEGGNFAANVTSGFAPLAVQFTDLCVGATAWQWNFGDGSPNSTVQNPVHTFTAVGSFDVTLTATTPGGALTVKKSGYVDTIFLALRINGTVSNPLDLTTQALNAYPNITITYTPSGVLTVATGPSLNDLLNSSAPLSNATSVAFYCSDGAVMTTTLANVRADPNAVFAYWNDSTLRGIIPSRSFTAKFVYAIRVYQDVPLAGFTANVTTGITPLTVRFNDTSSYYPTSWSWNFGDGGTSAERNATHTYNSPGTFTVSLTASNAAGGNTKTVNNMITVGQPSLIVNFSASVTSGDVPLTVQFTDLSANNPTGWQWNFGDGTPNGTVQNPSHTYLSGGNYTVTLTATNASGPLTTAKANYITVWPVALAVTGNLSRPLSLSMTNLHSLPNVSVNVSYTSNGNPRNLNGTGILLNDLLNMTGVWPGATSVTFTGSDGVSSKISLSTIRADMGSVVFFQDDGGLRNVIPSQGSSHDWIKNLTTIRVDQDSVAGFTANTTLGMPGLYVQFTDTSNGATSWQWNFGDGTANSTERNPVHRYPMAGRFNVTLTATTPGGTGTFQAVGLINVLLPVTGAVAHPLNLSVDDLLALPQVSFDKVYYSSGNVPHNGNFSGASLNAFIDSLGMASSATSIYFHASDNYYMTISISSIRADANSILAIDCEGNGTLRDVFPSETYGTNWVSIIDRIIVTQPAPVANFWYNTTNGGVPLTVAFTDLSTVPSSWLWNFGDGTPNSTVQNPVHTYASAGVYTVTLTVQNSAGSNTKVMNNLITASAVTPVANFTSNVTVNNVPFAVQFTDTSTNSPTGWQWNFGDGSANSTDRNPVHTYSVAANYTVTLTASNTGGSNTSTKTGYIRAIVTQPTILTVKGAVARQLNLTMANLLNYPQLWENVSYIKVTGSTIYYVEVSGPLYNAILDDAGVAPSATTLTLDGDSPDGSSGATAILAEVRADPKAIIAILNDGRLRDIVPSWGMQCSWLYGVTTIIVNQPLPVAGFTASTTSGQAPFAVQFTDTTTNDPTGWQWNFGDGSANSTDKNPTHTYAAEGSYTVTLTATNSAGGDSETKTNYIAVSPPPEPIVLIVNGSVTNTLYLTLTSLNGYPQLSENVSYIKNNQTSYLEVTGPSLNTILTDANPLAGSTNVRFLGLDGFNVTIPLATITGDNGSVIAINASGSGLLRNVIPSQAAARDWVRNLTAITVCLPAPVAGFTASTTSGTAPLTVQFTDQSTGTPTAWQWNFGDGTPASTQQNPTHTYNTAGTYTVALTVTNTGGANTMTKSAYVSVTTATPVPTAAPTAAPTPAPTATPTPTPTPTATPTPTVKPTPTPTPTAVPGFEILVALCGLGIALAMAERKRM